MGLLLILGSSFSFAADTGTKEEAVALVKKAIEYLKANGQDKAFEDLVFVRGVQK